MRAVRRRSLFLLGAAGGAGLDQIHVRTRVLSYPSPTFVGQPWWVAPQFGVAAVAALEGARLFTPSVDEPTTPRLAGDVGWFVVSYLASGVFDRRGARAFGAASLFFWVARMVRRGDRRPLVAYALLLAGVGTTYEHVVAGTGLFSYSRPRIGHVPVWLPVLYLQGAPLAVDLARATAKPPGYSRR